MEEIIKGEVFEICSKIEEDSAVPKNIKLKIQDIIITLKQEEKEIDIRVNTALQELDEISEDINIPDHIRTQIWSIVSLLESLE